MPTDWTEVSHMKDKTNQVFWNRVSGRYDSFMRKDASLYDIICSLIRIHLHPGMRVLELAAGTGIISLRLANTGASITATDYSPAMIQKAKAKRVPRNVTFETADACRLRYADDSFDVVIMANALHIMPQPEQALKEVRRVLKPGGLFVCPTFVKPDNLSGKVRLGMLTLAGMKRYHTWNLKQLCEFLDKNHMHVTMKGMLSGTMPVAYVEAKADSARKVSTVNPLEEEDNRTAKKD